MTAEANTVLTIGDFLVKSSEAARAAYVLSLLDLPHNRDEPEATEAAFVVRDYALNKLSYDEAVDALKNPNS